MSQMTVGQMRADAELLTRPARSSSASRPVADAGGSLPGGVWTTRTPASANSCRTFLAPFSVPIADQYAMFAPWAVGYGQRAADLTHEQIIGIGCRRHDLNAP